MQLRLQDRPEETLSLYKEIIQRYGENTDTNVRQLAELARQGISQIENERKQLEQKVAEIQAQQAKQQK
jgi:hypothetical protein